MRHALRIARQGEGHVEPNPMVGCVLVNSGELIAEGFHRRYGDAHAEVDAIRSCQDARGSTAYVTLEPCCHHGKTPPCSDALIASGVTRVVIAMEDPYPRVSGGGIVRLREANIEVTLGVLREEAESLNAPYLKRVRTGMPWVIAKWAMTIDGKIATVSGESQWITGAASRRQVHRLRGRVDAIAVGMGTVTADDPILTARPTKADGSPETIARKAVRVVLCQRRLPPIDSRLVCSVDQAPLLIAASTAVDTGQLDQLEKAGVAVFRADTVDPQTLVTETLSALGRGEIRCLEKKNATNFMVEGGGRLLASFAQADQIDECHVYLGPLIFGGERAPGPVAGAGINHLKDALRLELVDVERLEDDVRLLYRR